MGTVFLALLAAGAVILPAYWRASKSHVPPAVIRAMTISVLMTTYLGERADRLARALESIYAQTVPADEVVLVLDGPIGAAQTNVITAYERIGGFLAARWSIFHPTSVLGRHWRRATALLWRLDHANGQRRHLGARSHGNPVGLSARASRGRSDRRLGRGVFEDAPGTRGQDCT